MQPLHLEVLVLNVTVGLAEIHTASHLVGALLRYGEEGWPETIGGLRWELLDGADLEVVLESCGARQSLFGTDWVPGFRVEGKICLGGRCPIDWHRL